MHEYGSWVKTNSARDKKEYIPDTEQNEMRMTITIQKSRASQTSHSRHYFSVLLLFHIVLLRFMFYLHVYFLILSY